MIITIIATLDIDNRNNTDDDYDVSLLPITLIHYDIIVCLRGG